MRTDEHTRTATLGRGRPRQADSDRRAPFAGHLRVFGDALDPDDRTYVRRKLGMKLGKFASSIERVSVRVEDVNGPRGGVDQACRVKVVLSGLPSVMYAVQDASMAAAIDRALTGSERAVRRAVRRSR